MQGHCVFRVDALPHTGVGHLSRCLALASGLRGAGMQVDFVCRDGERSAAWLVRESGFGLQLLPAVAQDIDPADSRTWLGTSAQADAQATADLIRSACGRADWLVVDHYAIDARWEGALRPHCQRLLAIDDLADRPHDCDLLLDQNLREDDPYRPLLPRHCRPLLGPRHALLRDEFRAAREQAAARDGRLRRILVFFGGSDPTGDTVKAVQALASLVPPVEADIIVGAMNPARAQIEATCAAHAHLHFACQVQDMAGRLARADLAIGGAGTSAWERMAVGLPALILEQAHNQHLNAVQLQCIGVARNLGPSAAVDAAAIAGAVREFREDPAQLQRMSLAAWSLVDGRGVERVCRAMAGLDIGARPATAADSAQLLAWRNDPAIRRFAHDAGLIDPAVHAAWLARTLADPQRQLLVCELRGEPLGVVRFDLGGGCALVSIYLVPAQLGKGLGPAVLYAAEQWLLGRRADFDRFTAEVLDDNRASHQLFRDCGYTRPAGRYEKRVAA